MDLTLFVNIITINMYLQCPQSINNQLGDQKRREKAVTKNDQLHHLSTSNCLLDDIKYIIVPVDTKDL